MSKLYSARKGSCKLHVQVHRGENVKEKIDKICDQKHTLLQSFSI